MTKPAVLPANAPDWAQDLKREVDQVKRDIQAINKLQAVLGRLNEYTVAELPSAAGDEKAVLVSDEVGGFTLAFSNGVDWLRVSDLAVVS